MCVAIRPGVGVECANHRTGSTRGALGVAAMQAEGTDDDRRLREWRGRPIDADVARRLFASLGAARPRE